MAKQSFTNDFFSFTAPPRVHFAFNPWLFKITNVDNISEFHLAGEVREPFNASCEFDIQRYVQREFDGVPDDIIKAIDYASEIAGQGIYKSIYFDLEGYLEDTSSGISEKGQSGTIYALWGAIGRGEVYGGDETIRWFFNYPFTLDVFAWGTEGNNECIVSLSEINDLEIEADSDGVYLANPIAAIRRYNAQLLEREADTYDIADFNEIHAVLSGLTAQVSGQEITTGTHRTVTLITDCTPLDAKDKVYLRWVDNLGRIRYHLFTQIDETEAVTLSSWNKPEQPEPEIYDSYNNDSQTTRQQFTATRSRTLAAACISKDEFERLVTVCRSPIVDVFDGYDDDGNALWHRVNMNASSYKRDRTHLQDFQFTVTDRAQTTQEL